MSNSITTPTPTSDHRPWHGHENPFEALFQHVEAKLKSNGSSASEVAALSDRLTALETRLTDGLKDRATSAEIASLKQAIAALEQKVRPAPPPPAPPKPVVEAETISNTPAA